MDSPASSDHPPLKSELVLPGFKEVFTPSRRHSWASCQTDSPYTAGAGSIGASSKLNSLLLSEQYSLSPDPREWGFDLSPHLEEPDDALHNPDAQMDRPEDRFKDPCSRGVLNLGCLALLGLFFVALFIGYPVGAYVAQQRPKFYGYNIGGINSTGQVPSMGNFGLIDQDTPKDALQHTSWRNPGDEWTLVFSDEFNTQGRSFYPGDDPYWEAVDLHYWATNNLEWYDPEAVSTQDGSLVIKFSQLLNHDLNYQGGLISTWNKFCFTGGLIETSVSLPGVNNVMGLWPAVWTMGRAHCSLELRKLKLFRHQVISAELDMEQPWMDCGRTPMMLATLAPCRIKLSTVSLKQHLSMVIMVTTISSLFYPHEDGTYVGRSAPEIDVFEAQMSGTPLSGEVSQSAQWAPFNAGYVWNNDTTTNMIIRDSSITRQNSFIGSITQQATSVITKTNPDCYELEQGCFSIYAFEYILWVSDNKESWTLNVQGLGPDPAVEISARPVPQEPMYILINLGMSKNFGEVDVAHLTFPVHMHVDYIRVYQPKDAINIGCSPRDFPTEAYINRYLEAYTNPNLTTPGYNAVRTSLLDTTMSKTFESLPVELIADILGELDLESLVKLAYLSRRLHTIASDASINPWRRPILRTLRCLPHSSSTDAITPSTSRPRSYTSTISSTLYETPLRTLGVRSVVPRQNWVEILSIANPGYLLYHAVIPNMSDREWEECFKRRFLPGWRRWKNDGTWREAFLKYASVDPGCHRSSVACTSDEAWTKYIVLNRNGSANELENSSRNFNPLAMFNEFKLQNNLAHLETRIRLVLEIADVRILAFGTLTRPHMQGCAGNDPQVAPAVDDHGVYPMQELNTSMNPISPSGPYARLVHPRPNPSHANYPFYTPGGGDKRWLGSGEVEEEGLQWVGGMMIVAQLLGPHTHDGSSDWPPLQDLDLAVGPGRSNYASFTWSDLAVVAPWMEERITNKISGAGLGH
ncbi:hypothetical protein EYR36_006494 [Pleurotus pulmonarius]|nr:hypothetical protein EYR36_006494 [Pleurotus pulmonarius]